MQKVWRRQFDGWWYLTLSEGGTRQQIKLVKGPNDRETKAAAERQTRDPFPCFCISGLIPSGYPLPKKGSFLLLVFKSGIGLCTTLRRSTLDKDHYYRSMIGERFTVVIETPTPPSA